MIGRVDPLDESEAVKRSELASAGMPNNKIAFLLSHW